MLKLLLAAAPYVLSASPQKPKKRIARSLMASLLFALSGLMLTAAMFVYLTAVYGAAIGFLSVSALFFLVGLIMFFKSKSPKSLKVNQPRSVQSTDPLAGLIPESLMSDPAVTKLVGQIRANPIATSLAAATIGMLITREIMKD